MSKSDDYRMLEGALGSRLAIAFCLAFGGRGGVYIPSGLRVARKQELRKRYIQVLGDEGYAQLVQMLGGIKLHLPEFAEIKRELIRRIVADAYKNETRKGVSNAAAIEALAARYGISKNTVRNYVSK